VWNYPEFWGVVAVVEKRMIIGVLSPFCSAFALIYVEMLAVMTSSP
jgi:hypothetical protein